MKRPHATYALVALTIGLYGISDMLAVHPQAHPWQMLTYAFGHVTWWHLLLNMLALLSFGPTLERTWGKLPFLLVYAACAVAGGAAAAMGDSYVLGSSGALFGLFAAYTVLRPDAKLISLFILPMRGPYVVVGYMMLSGVMLAMGWLPQVAHATHIAGALVGFIAAYSLPTNNNPPE